MTVRQKLSKILENKVFEKSKVSKNDFKKKFALKLLFLIEKNKKDSDDSWQRKFIVIALFD